jgi:hypothetical protein
MDTFTSIEQLNKAFKSHEISKIPSEITIGATAFSFRESLIPSSLIELNNGKKILALYNEHPKSSGQRLVLVWSMKSGLVISPLLVKLVGHFRGGSEESVMKTESQQASKNEKPEEPVIGSHIDVILNGFNDNQTIRGKVDTGATINSLHATNIKIRKDPYEPEQEIVDFEFNGKRYSVGLAQYQSVQSADGGIKYRPVVQFTVKYGEKVVPDVMFNLNDREDMEDKLLIGMNLLSGIGYKIDPTLESIDLSVPVSAEEWELILEEIEGLEIDQSVCGTEDSLTGKTSDVHALYEYLVKQEVTFSTLLGHVKMDTIKIMENLES